MHIKKTVPRLTLIVLLVALISWLCGAYYTLRMNPDVRDFTAGAQIKAEWNRRLRERYASNNIVFGGSSSSFSVDPAVAVNDYDVPLSNLALGAGMGAKVLVRFAAFHSRPGDTLIMTIEPGLFSGSSSIPQLGQQFSIAVGHPEWASEKDQVELEPALMPATYLSALRPGGAHIFTLLGKLAMRRPFYRYKIGEFLETGQKVTEARAIPVTPRGQVTISPGSHAFLATFRKWAQTNNVRVVYTLPWAYCSPEEAPGFRNENLQFLEQIVTYFPVLADFRLGAYTNASHFADTAFHLTHEGSKIRTRELVEALRKPWLISSNEVSALGLQ